MKFHWKMPLKINRTIPVKIRSAPSCRRCRASDEDGRGKILHTRNRKQIQSIANCNWQSIGQFQQKSTGQVQATTLEKSHWQVKVRLNTPLKIHWKMPLKIHDEFWGVDFWCAIFCPLSCRCVERRIRLRTDGVNTNGAAAKVTISDRLC